MRFPENENALVEAISTAKGIGVAVIGCSPFKAQLKMLHTYGMRLNRFRLRSTCLVRWLLEIEEDVHGAFCGIGLKPMAYGVVVNG